MDFSDLLKTEIFQTTTLSDIFKQIYQNSTNKKEEIDSLLSELTGIADAESAVLIVPLIKDYLDVSVKNDEQLIKMSKVIQSLLTGKASESLSNEFDDIDMKQLEKDSKSIIESDQEIDNDMEKLESDHDDLLDIDENDILEEGKDIDYDSDSILHELEKKSIES